MNADSTIKTTAKPPKHDWSRFDSMTEAQRNAASRHDPGAGYCGSRSVRRAYLTVIARESEVVRKALASAEV
jgi:hypothetical protein